LGIGPELDRVHFHEGRELDRRVDHYRHGRLLPDLVGRDVVLVEDGLATGVTAEAAVVALRERDAGRLVPALPACAPDTAALLRAIADDVVCVIAPTSLPWVPGMSASTRRRTTRCWLCCPLRWSRPNQRRLRSRACALPSASRICDFVAVTPVDGKGPTVDVFQMLMQSGHS
jgi:hypothetical protein